MPEPIRCPACDAPLDASRVDLRRGFAPCRHCGTVCRLDDLPGAEGRAARPEPPRSGSPPIEEEPATRPERFRTIRRNGAVAVQWRWRSPLYLFLVPFSVAWNAFLVFWYGLLLSIFAGGGGAGPPGFGAAGWGMAAFGLPLVAVGIGLTYYTACGVLNRTTVTAAHGELRVRHHPLPWPGDRTFDGRSFDRLFVRDREVQHEHSVSTIHDLLAVTRDGGEVTLLKALSARNEACFLAETLGEALGVPTKP